MLYKSLIVEHSFWSVNIDLRYDFCKYMAHNITNMGYTYTSIEHAPVEFFNIKKMLIPAIPQQVKYSKEFVCPKGYEKALAEFVQKIENGQSLRPFQSSRVKKSTNKDLLLSDWNIHHFHLTRQFHSDGFAKRSQFQIFAFITDDTAYLIQIYPHSRQYLYCLQEMIRIIHDNWSELIEKNKLKGIVSLSEHITDAKYDILRKAHVSTMVDLGNGNIYGLIGGGYATDGTALEAVRNADYWHNRMVLCEKNIIANIVSILNGIDSLVEKQITSNLDIELFALTDEKLILYEKNNKVMLELNIVKGGMQIRFPNDVFSNLTNL